MSEPNVTVHVYSAVTETATDRDSNSETEAVTATERAGGRQGALAREIERERKRGGWVEGGEME